MAGMVKTTSIASAKHFTTFLAGQAASGRSGSASEDVRAGQRLRHDPGDCDFGRIFDALKAKQAWYGRIFAQSLQPAWSPHKCFAAAGLDATEHCNGCVPRHQTLRTLPIFPRTPQCWQPVGGSDSQPGARPAKNSVFRSGRPKRCPCTRTGRGAACYVAGMNRSE